MAKNKISNQENEDLKTIFKRRKAELPPKGNLEKLTNELSKIDPEKRNKIFDSLAIIKFCSNSPSNDTPTKDEEIFVHAFEKFQKALYEINLIERRPNRTLIQNRWNEGDEIHNEEIVFPITANIKRLPGEVCVAIQRISYFCSGLPRRGSGRKGETFRDLYIYGLLELMKEAFHLPNRGKAKRAREKAVELLRLIGESVGEKALESVVKKVKGPSFEAQAFKDGTPTQSRRIT